LLSLNMRDTSYMSPAATADLTALWIDVDLTTLKIINRNSARPAT
jgi:hypothetical protein